MQVHLGVLNRDVTLYQFVISPLWTLTGRWEWEVQET